MEITYKDTIFNDLQTLYEKEKISKAKQNHFVLTIQFRQASLSTIDQRINKIVGIRKKGAEELNDDVREPISKIKSKKVEIEEIAT